VTQAQGLSLINALLWQCMVIAGPVLAVVLIVGLVISVLQATTQLQEMTLSYVPKMVAAGLMLILLEPWMIGRLTNFAITTLATVGQLR
jgi:flagellar biosynthesis protein FliQ